MKILLVCYAGMSTSMMAQRLEEEGEKRGLQVEVAAMPLSEIEDHLEGVDVILLGPQVRFASDDVHKLVGDSIPVEVLEPQDFGLMRADVVMDKVVKLTS